MTAQATSRNLSAGQTFALLGTLYLAQGLPYGFFTQALPVLMKQQGIALSLIGLSSLLTLPWALKFLWAPYMDRHGSTRWGHRRGWILPLQGASALAMIGLAFVDFKQGLWVVLAGFLLANLLASTQDIATDGLAVEILKPEERGIGNGLQVAGYRVGMIIGGGVLLVVFHYVGWRWTFLLMGLCLALSSLPVWKFKEAPRPQKTTETDAPAGPTWAMWVSWLKRPGMLPWLVVLLLYKAGDALATGMLRPFLVDIGLNLAEIGWLLGTAGFTAGLLGALVGGVGVHHLGRRTALVGFGFFQALAVASYILPAWGFSSMPWLVGVCIFEHFASGMATAALFTIMMDRCSPDQAATDYTLQASLAVIAKGVAVAASGFSAATFGFAGHFLLAAGWSLLGLFAAIWVFRTPPDKATHTPPTAHPTTHHRRNKPCHP
jgi:RhtX/FptX family siderophore transporter